MNLVQLTVKHAVDVYRLLKFNDFENSSKVVGDAMCCKLDITK